MKLKRAGLIVGVLSCLAFFSGGIWTFLLSNDASRDVYKNLGLFVKIYDIVKKQYVEEPKDEVMVEGAIRGMLDALDPHSQRYTRQEFSEMQDETRGQFGGLGIEIAKKDGMLTVVTPIEDTPAFAAGIKPGDIIEKINDTLTEKLSIFDAVKLMKGKPGTTVQIWIHREGVDKLLPFKLKRAIINVKSVTFKEVNGFGVIKLKQFVDRTSDEMHKALKELAKNHPIKGLILDLRNNPGGLLQQAIEVSDTFLDKGLIVETRGRDKSQDVKSFAVAKGTEPDYPLVVLINGGSASASEIVSGALQDNKRATVIGTQSFGKGSVQNVIPLDDGSGIKLTVALYYTPSGRTIQGVGITPDIAVKALDDTTNEFTIHERDLPGHIVGKNEIEAAKKKANEAEKVKAKLDLSKLTPLEKEDYQLAKAIEFLEKKTGTSPTETQPAPKKIESPTKSKKKG